MKRLAILALAFPLASCSIRTNTLGVVDVWVPEAPAKTVTPVAAPVATDRNPQLHYDACLELATNSTACPQAPTHFDAIVDPEDGPGGRVVVRDACVEHPAEQPENDCAHLVAVP